MKYVKWQFDDVPRDDGFETKINEIIVASDWNPKGGLDDSGGINFSNEECALRWVTRGDTLYDVIIPEDAEVISIENSKTPGGIIRANKIMVNNPRKISEELLHELYKKSKLPERTYFECIAALAMRNYLDTCLEIIRDKVTKDNIDDVLERYNTFIKPWHEGHVNQESWNYVLDILNEIKSPLDISLTVTKEPYIKKLTDDKVINLTGQSGSGKSFYAKENFNSEEYIVLDTDDILSDSRFENATGLNREIGEYLRDKYEEMPDLGHDFDLIYEEIINYCKDLDKIIVIDCAQIHCVQDINILKGKVVIIRTDIDTCYNRTIDRWIKLHNEYTEEELETYKERKKNIYKWYKGSNEFIRKIDSI